MGSAAAAVKTALAQVFEREGAKGITQTVVCVAPEYFAAAAAELGVNPSRDFNDGSIGGAFATEHGEAFLIATVTGTPKGAVTVWWEGSDHDIGMPLVSVPLEEDMVKYVNPDNPAAGVLIETRSDPHTGITVTVSPGDDGEFHKPKAAPDQAEQNKAAVAPMLTPQDIENAEIQQMQSDLDQARAAIVGTVQRVEGKQFDHERRVAQSDAASDTPSSPFASGPVETAKDTSGKLTTAQRGGPEAEKSTLDEPPARTVARGMLTVNDLGPLPGEPVSPVFADDPFHGDDTDGEGTEEGGGSGTSDADTEEGDSDDDAGDGVDGPGDDGVQSSVKSRKANRKK